MTDIELDFRISSQRYFLQMRYVWGISPAGKRRFPIGFIVCRKCPFFTGFAAHFTFCLSSSEGVVFEEIDDIFDDGSHIVYVNGAYKGNDEIGKLLHDFGCKESKDMYYPELAKGMRHFKEEEGGRKVMCEAVEKYAKSYAEQYAKSYAEQYAKNYAENARLNSLLESIKNLMANMKMGAEQAMSVLGIDDHDREILQKRL